MAVSEQTRYFWARAKSGLRRLATRLGSVALGSSPVRLALKAALRKGWISGGRFSGALFGNALPRADFFWQHRFAGRAILISVTPALPVSWRAVLLLEVSEPEVVRFWRAWLDVCGSHGVFFDVGANLGIHSCRFLAHEVRCVLFEPEECCFRFIRAVAELNGWAPAVEPVVVAEADGHYEFFVGSSTVFSSRSKDWLERHGEKPERIIVRGTSLDSYCDRCGIDPSLIKIDVEQGEVSLLTGASRVFSRARPCCLLETWGEQNRKAVWQWFQQKGYEPPLVVWGSRRTGWAITRVSSVGEFIAERNYNFVFVGDRVLGQELARAVQG